MRKELLLLSIASTLASFASGAPIPSDRLQLIATIELYEELGYINSSYNPRHFGGSNFVGQLHLNGRQGIARYPAGSSTAAASLDFASSSSNTETRMWAPMNGGSSVNYLLLAGGSNESYFSRLGYSSLDDRTFAGPPLRPESFDWVDDDTLIFTSYEPALRGNLYVADVQEQPFDVTISTMWNASGFVATQADRIRNARVGDVHSEYAYFGESQTAVNARYWAVDLGTGISTQLGALPEVSGTGSWGLWTVKEAGGYLYVHTTDDGVYVYSMTDAITVGPLAARFTQSSLEELTGQPGPFWGFDVAENGNRMLLSGFSRVFEIGPQDLPGDFDLDRDVDGSDFLHWQQGNSPQSGSDDDLAIWKANFGWSWSATAQTSAVPEPTFDVLLFLLLTIAYLHRRAA